MRLGRRITDSPASGAACRLARGRSERAPSSGPGPSPRRADSTPDRSGSQGACATLPRARATRVRWPTPTIVAAALVAVLQLTGCATPPEQRGQAFDPTFGATPAPAVADAWRSEIVLTALSHLDTPYRFGGSSTSGLDCSALVQRAYAAVGVQLPRTSSEQSRVVQRRTGNPVPGDIVFFAIRAPQGNRRIDHVGVYLGDGRFVHAPRPGARVRIESIDNRYWAPRLQFAGYVPPPPSAARALAERIPEAAPVASNVPTGHDPIGEFLAASGHAPAVARADASSSDHD